MSALLALLVLAQAAAPAKPAKAPAVKAAPAKPSPAKPSPAKPAAKPAPSRKLPAPSAAAKAQEAALKDKMETWRGTWRIGPEGVSCKTATSTGDTRLDTIGCRAIQFCYAAKLPAITAVQDGDLSDEDKKSRTAALLNGAKDCVAGNRAAAIEVLAGTRLAPKLSGGPEPYDPKAAAGR